MDEIAETCPQCNQPFELGSNGTILGCDKCTGVKRDKKGYAWHPEEKYQVYQKLKDGKLAWVKRPNYLVVVT